MSARWVRRLAVLAAAVATAVSAVVAPAAAEGTGTVRGLITDERGDPTSSGVMLLPVDGRDTIYSSSGDDGRYTFADVPTGQYRLGINDNVHPTQYAPGSDGGDGATVFEVVEGQVTTIDEQYLPLGTVVVTVTDATTGLPVAGACAAVSAGPGPHACGNARGVVRVPAVWPGLWTVDVYDATGAHWPATIEDVSVARGATTRLRATIRPAASITATVRDAATGEPMAACVRTAVSGNHGLLAGDGGCYWSGETGKLVIGPLDPSTVQLFVEPQDAEHGALWVTRTGGTGDQRKARVITAAVGRPVRLPAIEVPAGGTISGTVRDRVTGAAVGSVCAYPFAFDPRLGQDFGPRCSNSSGRYTLTGLGPYAWPVLFATAPIYGRAWQWSGDVADRFDARLVPVTSGATATLDARVVTGGTVSGSVVDPAGSQPFAYVYPYNARTGDFAAFNTSTNPTLEDAPFTIKGLATQQIKIEYTVTAPCWYRDKPTFATATTLAVTAGADTGPFTLRDCATP